MSDDQLQTDPRLRRHSAAFVAGVVLSPVIFQVGFNYGAFDVVFVEHLLTIWVASLAAIVMSFIVAPDTPGRPGWIRRVLLALPTFWIVSEFAMFAWSQEWPWLEVVEQTLGWAMVLVGLPVILHTLLSTAYPGVGQVVTGGLRVALVVVWLAALGLGYLVGDNHDSFFLCEDFERSGSYVPQGCWEGVSAEEDQAETGET